LAQSRWEVNVEMDLELIGLEDVDWINLAQEMSNEDHM